MIIKVVSLLNLVYFMSFVAIVADDEHMLICFQFLIDVTYSDYKGHAYCIISDVIYSDY